MTNFVMQVLKDIDVDGGTLHEWSNINRGNTQYQRTWEAIKDGKPVRVLHAFNQSKGGRSWKVVKNAEALPKGFEASGFEVAA